MLYPIPPKPSVLTPKIVLIDIGGVMDGIQGTLSRDRKMINGVNARGQTITLANITENDFLQVNQDPGTETPIVSLLKNAVNIIINLNSLAEQGYTIMTNSTNPLDGQQKLFSALEAFATTKGLSFPLIHFIIRDKSESVPITHQANCCTPYFSQENSRQVAFFKEDYVTIEKDPQTGDSSIVNQDKQFHPFLGKLGTGKDYLRAAGVALWLYLTKKSILSDQLTFDFSQCIVLDDGHSIINKARQEGFNAYEVNNMSGSLEVSATDLNNSLIQALVMVRTLQPTPPVSIPEDCSPVLEETLQPTPSVSIPEDCSSVLEETLQPTPSMSLAPTESKKPYITERYQAPKPTKLTSFKKEAIKRLIFPPLLLWDALKFLATGSLGWLIGKIILPGGGKLPANAQPIMPETLMQEYPEINVKSIQIQTHDGALLPTLEFSPKTTPLKPKYIIYFMGNNGIFENQINSFIDDSIALQCHTIGFNYRGVGFSTGTHRSTDDLVTDSIAQVQRLLDQGIDPHQILLNGHSLGGGIATLVAYHFKQKGIDLYLFNDRSFSTLDKVVSGHSPTIVRFLIEPITRFFLALFSWSINAATAYKKLSHQYKTYLVLAANGTQACSKIDDPIITHYGSLATAVETGPVSDAPKLTWQKPQHMQCIHQGNGHNMDLPSLREASQHTTPITGQQFFEKCVNSMNPLI